MTQCVDVRVDAQGHRRSPALGTRDGRNPVQFSRRLRIDDAHAGRHRVGQFVGRLAHAGKHDVGRRKACPLRHLNLANGVGVGAAAQRPEEAYDFERGIGLESVMDDVRKVREGRIDGAVRVAHRPRTVDVDGRPDGVGNGGHADAVAEEPALRLRP